jgi:hypothetical protein
MTHQSGTLVTFTSASSSNGCWIFARFGGGIAGGCGGMAFCSGRNERITGPDILPMSRKKKRFVPAQCSCETAHQRR